MACLGPVARAGVGVVGSAVYMTQNGDRGAIAPILASLPRRSSWVVCALRLRSAFLLSALLRRGAGKWSVIFSCVSVVSLGGKLRALLMECCRVALSNVSGDGVPEMAIQSSSRMCRHLGAMGRSQSGVVLMLRFIFS